MQKHSTAKSRKGSTSQKRDPLAPFREQAQPLIRLYFDPKTPSFICDLLSSWMTDLENETQTNYANDKAVAEVFLPLALQRADRAGLDAFSVNGGFYLSALHDAASCIESGIEVRHEPSERERLSSDLRREADAFATLINSKNLPEDVRLKIGELYDELTDGAHSHPETIRAQYPAAMLKQRAAAEGGAQDGRG